MINKPLAPQHKARKRFGQNFLQSPTVIQQIIDAIQVQKTDHIVEIGPGKAALTNFLQKAQQLSLIELDRTLISHLTQHFTRPHVHIFNADALKFDYQQLVQQSQQPLRIVGNLPYNISTPLLFHLLTFSACIADMHFMLQKEVVNRLAAQPGEKNYGRLTVMIQYHCQVEALFNVPAHAFNPQPKVESAIVRLIPHAKPIVTLSCFAHFQQLVQQAFSQRRKTLRNNLKGLLDEAQILAAHINPKIRAEQLSLEDFARLTQQLSD